MRIVPAVLILASLAAADTVVLRNGLSVHGSTVEKDGKTLDKITSKVTSVEFSLADDSPLNHGETAMFERYTGDGRLVLTRRDEEVIVGARVAGDAEVPDFRFLALACDEIAVEDTWFVDGMSGTGSNDILIENVVVPEERSVSMADMADGGAHGADRLAPGRPQQMGFLQGRAVTAEQVCLFRRCCRCRTQGGITELPPATESHAMAYANGQA